MKGLQLAAIVATLVVVWTAAGALRRPASQAEQAGLGDKWPKPTNVVRTPCTIERAVFGGTGAAVLKIRKDRKLHYVVMSLPSNEDQPAYDWIVQQQERWLKNQHGDVPPSALVGIYPTIDEAELKAGNLCRSN